MRITIPFLGGIPLDIAEEKVPALMDTVVDKFLPNLSKYNDAAKSLGIDLTPAFRRVLGGTEPVKPEAINVPTEEEIQKAGYWKHTDGKWYPPDLAIRATSPAPAPAQAPVPQQVPRICATCVRGNPSTGLPFSAFNPPCNICQVYPNRASHLAR